MTNFEWFVLLTMITQAVLITIFSSCEIKETIITNQPLHRFDKVFKIPALMLCIVFSTVVILVSMRVLSTILVMLL